MNAVCTDDNCPDYAIEGTHTHEVKSCMAPWCGIDGKYGNPGVCNAPGGHQYRPPEERVAVEAPAEAAAVAGGLSSELTDWWVEIARREAAAVVPKAVEYSSADLAIMGFVLTHFPPIPSDEVSGEEIACAFYALGKIARAFGAYAEGRRPSDDTWHDNGVYVRMIQRIRESGGWPGGG